MAGNSVTIEAKLDEKGVVSGAKRIKVSLEDIKRADGSLDWKGVEAGEGAAERSGDGFTVLKGALANLAANGIAVAAGALKGLAVSVVEVGQTFETSMSKVAALSGATGAELEALEAKARELGAETTFSASQAADALGYMALAGWDTQQMLEGVGSVLTLAQAGEMDLAAASDLVTDYLSAFNMEAAETGRMVDVLAYSQANANTSVEGLGQALKNCAANANAAGLDIESTASAISMMANQGLKGSEAGTALNAVLRDMTAKMEDGAIAIGEQSVAVMDAEGNYRDFVDILDDIEKATDGMGDAQKAAALQSTFTADSIKGLNLMLNAGAGEMGSFREQLYDCAGAGEEMAAVMTDNLGGDLAAMGSAFDELRLKIYDGLQAPLRAAVQFVTSSVVPALTWLVEHAEYVGIAVSGIGAAVAALRLPKVTSALAAVPKLLAGFSGGPVMAVVGALTALAAGAKWAYDNVEPFRTAVDELGAALSASFGPIVGQVCDSLSSIFPSALSTASSFIQSVIVPALEALALFITETVVPAVGEAAAFVSGTVMPALAELSGWLAGNLVPVAQAFADTFQNDVLPGLQQLAAWVAENVVPALADMHAWFSENVVPVLREFAAFVMSEVVPAVSSMFSWFAEHIVPVLGQLAGFILGSVVPALGLIVQWVGSQIVPVLQKMFQWFSANILPILASLARFILNTVVPALQKLFGWFADQIVPVLKSVFDAIGSVVGALSDFAGAAGRAIDDAKRTVKAGIDAIVGFFTGAKFSWPKIPMPHFQVKPSGWQVGDLLKGSIPTLGVDFYATGGEFNGPRIIGVGEAGRETVLPLTNRQTMRHVGEAITEAGGMGDPSVLLAILEELRAIRREFPAAIDRGGVKRIVWNKREVARAVSESEGYW